ncbi:MAG: ABC transporter permease [Vicinamibacteraceae bacterium]
MGWLFRLLVDDADRRAIDSDLAELHDYRRRRDGADAADRWLRRQRRIYPWHLLADRAGTALLRVTTMPHLWSDVRHTLRSLFRVPALSATIVLTVGTALGATVAAIVLTRAVLVNPLPYADADRLQWVYTDNPPYRFSLSVVDYRALEADHPAFSAVAAFQRTQVAVSDGDVSERVTARTVTGSYFPLLGQKPYVGRLFDASDDARDDRVVVLTYGYWARRFGSDPTVLGRSMTIDGARATVVGVLERTSGPLEHDVALFSAARWPTPTRKGPFFTTVLGRLRPDMSADVAQQTLRATNARLFPIWRSSYQDEKATWGLVDLRARVIGEVGSTLIFLLAAVACVLLIACANAVNLLIARSLQRGRELAIRGALGASTGRLLQYVLVEASLLTVGAALIGLGVAAFVLQLVGAYGGDYIPRIDEVRFSATAVAWLAGLAVASGVVMGIVPAWYGARLRMDQALRGGGRSSTDGPTPRRIQRALVAAEFALATPLLVAGALILASLDRLSHVPVGIDTSHLLTASVSLPRARYPQETSREAFWKRALERLAALPGVQSVALSDGRPPSESSQQNNFDLEDRPTPAGQHQPVSTWVGVSTGFFTATGLALERGRLLDERSLQDDVVVVDRAWARRFFPGEEVLGRRFRGGGCTTCPWTTVVGVVGDVRWTGLDASGPLGTVYYPFVDLSTGFVLVRTAGDPLALHLAVRQAVKALDPGLALSDVATGDELMAEALATPRYLTILIGMFAGTALILSLVGIYGVMAYFVQQHTLEIGIRLAIGGNPGQVRRLVVWHGVRLVVAGVVVGTGAAVLATRLMSNVLFGVSATDLRVIVGVPAALLVAAVAACLIPAQRAAALDPAEILRDA